MCSLFTVLSENVQKIQTYLSKWNIFLPILSATGPFQLHLTSSTNQKQFSEKINYFHCENAKVS